MGQEKFEKALDLLKRMQEGDCKITVDGVEYDGNEDDDVRHAGRFLTPFFTVTPAPATTFSRHSLQLELVWWCLYCCFLLRALFSYFTVASCSICLPLMGNTCGVFPVIEKRQFLIRQFSTRQKHVLVGRVWTFVFERPQ